MEATGAAAGFATFGTELQAHPDGHGCGDGGPPQQGDSAPCRRISAAASLTASSGRPSRWWRRSRRGAPSAEASAMLADASVRRPSRGRRRPRAWPVAAVPVVARGGAQAAGQAGAGRQHVAAPAPAPAWRQRRLRCGAGAARGIGGGGGAGAAAAACAPPSPPAANERASVAGAAVSHRVVPRRSLQLSVAVARGGHAVAVAGSGHGPAASAAAGPPVRRRRAGAAHGGGVVGGVGRLWEHLWGEHELGAGRCFGAPIDGVVGQWRRLGASVSCASAGAVSERGVASKKQREEKDQR